MLCCRNHHRIAKISQPAFECLLIYDSQKIPKIIPHILQFPSVISDFFIQKFLLLWVPQPRMRDLHWFSRKHSALVCNQQIWAKQKKVLHSLILAISIHMREAHYSAVPNKCVYPKDTTSETGFILRNFPCIEQSNHES